MIADKRNAQMKLSDTIKHIPHKERGSVFELYDSM